MSGTHFHALRLFSQRGFGQQVWKSFGNTAERKSVAEGHFVGMPLLVVKIHSVSTLPRQHVFTCGLLYRFPEPAPELNNNLNEHSHSALSEKNLQTILSNDLPIAEHCVVITLQARSDFIERDSRGSHKTTVCEMFSLSTMSLKR